ncbi:MAG: hypothetical protein Q9213_002099 [Squamulea squamosa]
MARLKDSSRTSNRFLSSALCKSKEMPEANTPQKDSDEKVSDACGLLPTLANELYQSLQPLRWSSRIQKLHIQLPRNGATPGLVPPPDIARSPNPKVTSAKPDLNGSSFPFLSLPPEIRNMIYRYIVRFANGVVRTTKTKTRLQLWLVNRQFYDESSELFYHENTFKFYSCYVRTGEDPFGPRLDRIERCYLHLALTRRSGKAFLQWFINEFAMAVTAANNLKYLLVRMTDYQLDCVKQLEQLSKIRFALVHLDWETYFVNRRFYPESRYDLGYQRTQFEQRLERLMMRDGKSETAVVEGLSHGYVSSPLLSTELTGQALQLAQSCGGWADVQPFYHFLGIKRTMGMFDFIQEFPVHQSLPARRTCLFV